MNCSACEEAEKNPWTNGSYMNGCPSCSARAFATSPQAKEALLGTPGPLQAAMRQFSGTQENYRQLRIEVYRWMKLIDEARQKESK
jgi:predicted  nucleic acid-binding Zn-ribbon protein